MAGRAVALAAGVFMVSCCGITAVISLLLALVDGTSRPYHVLIGIALGGVVSIVPALLAAWLLSRRKGPGYQIQ